MESIERLIKINVEPPKTKEELQQIMNKLKEQLGSVELNLDYQLPQGTLLKFKESTETINNIISEKFPSVDPEKFIRFLLTSPIKPNVLDFGTLMNLFSSLDKSLSRNISYSDLEASLEVSEPTKIVGKVSYLNFVINIIFPILIFLLTQYQTAQTTEQLNGIENQDETIINQNELIIWQNENIEDLLGVLTDQIEKDNDLFEEKIYHLIEQQSKYDANQEKIIDILDSLKSEN